MTLTNEGWYRRALSPQFPRSAKYEPAWVLENSMGPNVLWLTESLTDKMDLKSDMRVLDLGCGKAVSSIFLAKEFGVKVWAFDLWIAANENSERAWQFDLAERVFPIHGEAHALPFQDDFFDAIVSMDAYHYWGLEEGYLEYLVGFLRPGAQVGILVPGTVRDVPIEEMPEFHQVDTFKTSEWWKSHWEKSGVVSVERCEALEDGWKIWAEGSQLKSDLSTLRGEKPSTKWSTPLINDAGATMGLIRLTASKT